MSLEELKKAMARTEKIFKTWIKASRLVRFELEKTLHYYEKELKKLNK